MGRRVAAVVVLLALIVVERFAWYAMKASLPGLTPDLAESLSLSVGRWALVVSLFSALAALVVPRSALLVVGCTVAFVGAVVTLLPVDVVAGVRLQSIGVGIERVVWLAMLAALPVRTGMKVVVVVLGYAAINIGASQAVTLSFTFGAWPACLGFLAASVLAGVVVVLARASGVEAPTGDPARALGLFVFAAPAVVAHWQLTERAMSLPSFDSNDFGIVTETVIAGCAALALVFFVATELKRLPEFLPGVLALGGLLLATCCLVVVACTPPRAAPLFATGFVLMSACVEGIGRAPAIVHDVLMIGGSLAALVLVVVLRRRIFEPLLREP